MWLQRYYEVCLLNWDIKSYSFSKNQQLICDGMMQDEQRWCITSPSWLKSEKVFGWSLSFFQIRNTKYRIRVSQWQFYPISQYESWYLAYNPRRLQFASVGVYEAIIFMTPPLIPGPRKSGMILMCICNQLLRIEDLWIGAFGNLWCFTK